MTIRNDVAGKVREVEKVWFTRKDAAKYLGVSVSFIRRMEASIRYSKVGGLVFIAKSELDRFIKKNDVLTINQ